MSESAVQRMYRSFTAAHRLEALRSHEADEPAAPRSLVARRRAGRIEQAQGGVRPGLVAGAGEPYDGVLEGGRELFAVHGRLHHREAAVEWDSGQRPAMHEFVGVEQRSFSPARIAP